MLADTLNRSAIAASSMRLLHIIGSVDPASGGPIEGILRQNEACGGASGPVQRHIVTLDPPSAPFLEDFPIPVSPLAPAHRRGPLARYRYSPALAPWLHDNLHRFDAAIVHGLWNYAPFGASRVLPSAGIPYFVFPHGMLDPWFRQANPLKHVAKQLFWTVGEGRLLANARTVFFTSQEERRAAEGVFKGHRYRGEVVGYGIASPPIASESQDMAFRAAVPGLHRPFLLFLGRIHKKKGCDLLVEAYSREASKLDEDLVIAGPDNDDWRLKLSQIAASHGVSERVHWAGPLYGAAKWGALRSAAAFVLPSHQENFGIAVAEALACGTPVLVSDKVNICSEIARGGAGVVAADSLSGTVGLLRRWQQLSTAERSTMGRAARALFMRRFDVRSTAPSLIKRITELL